MIVCLFLPYNQNLIDEAYASNRCPYKRQNAQALGSTLKYSVSLIEILNIETASRSISIVLDLLLNSLFIISKDRRDGSYLVDDPVDDEEYSE